MNNNLKIHMGNIDTNELERLSIPELMGKNFFIPDYQRGYRWEKIHIFQLLSDIWDFSNNSSGEFYCLQPIVVKECSDEVRKKYILNSEYDDNRWFEVIDGQQRLTTIRLIIQMNNLIWGMHVSHVIFISKFAGYENPGQSIGI